MREYYAKELPEMLHDLEEGPHDLPWAVYQKGTFIDLWTADCADDRVARILVDALTQEEDRIEKERLSDEDT